MAPSPALIRRRRVAAVVALAAAAALVVFAILQLTGSRAAEPQAAAQATPTATPKPKPLPQLPRGGRKILPHYRVVAYYGAPQAAELGALGIGKPSSAAKKLAHQAKPYARKT